MFPATAVIPGAADTAVTLLAVEPSGVLTLAAVTVSVVLLLMAPLTRRPSRLVCAPACDAPETPQAPMTVARRWAA